jgi:hypothetical protein
MRNIVVFATFLISLLIQNMVFAQSLSPEQVVQQNLEAYNNRDIEKFMAYFSPEITLFTFPESQAHTVGLEAVRKLYQELFDLSPNLHSTILNRIVFDNKVIDHEKIVGRRGAKEIIEMVLIYEVKNEKIFRITAIRK